MNEKPIHVSEVDIMANSLIAIGTSPYSRENAERMFEEIKNVFLNSQEIRRSGSAALDLCHVACRQIRSFF